MIYVRETFTSYQGSGHLSGLRQHFVRFAGCSVDCPIRSECDEPAALTRRGADQRTVESLVDEALAAVGPRGWLHITGGEPTDQDAGLQDLARTARARGLYVHLQTSGIRRVPIQWDWLTVSPKMHDPAQTFGQELVVIDDGKASAEWCQRLRRTTSFWCYYVCPLWGRELGAAARLAEQAGGDWMLTTQMHKHGGLR